MTATSANSFGRCPRRSARDGCSLERLNASLRFLHTATHQFSCENAIRPFLKQFPDQTLAFLLRCTSDPNYHVRRLASEGTRPLLPWSVCVSLDQSKVVAILDRLHNDSTRYVMRSVANHLNDISKSSPKTVYNCLARWRNLTTQYTNELAWMSNHALRTLMKRYEPEALKMLGYTAEPKLRLGAVIASATVRIGEHFEGDARYILRPSRNSL